MVCCVNPVHMLQVSANVCVYVCVHSLVCVHGLVCVHSCKHPSLQEEGTLPSLLKHRHACMHHLNLLHIPPPTQLVLYSGYSPIASHFHFTESVHCDLHQDIPFRHTLSDGMLCTVHDNAFPTAKYTMSAVKCTKCSILHPHQMVCCGLIYILFVSLHKRCAQSAT